MRFAEIPKIIDSMIVEFSKDPVDLLGIGDTGGEAAYITNARSSYERTVRDISSLQIASKDSSAPVRVLEIGSYLGVVSCSLSRMGYEVTALDLPEFMGNEQLRDRYRRESVKVLSANLRDYVIPVDTGSFDLVIMCETLEHLNFNPLPLICEINRVLRPAGLLYISLPNLCSLVNRAKLLVGRSIHNPISDFTAQLGRRGNMIVGIHWREYTIGEIHELLNSGGFTVTKKSLFTYNRASLAGRIIYALFPPLRQNLTVIGRKDFSSAPFFHFTDATR